MVVTVGGRGFPSGAVTSPFVTALVLDALHALGERFDIRPLIERGLAYLLHEMEAGGFWRFYRCDPPLRHDLDSRSVTLLALRRHGVPLDYLAAAGRIASHRDGTGRFQTWVADTPPPLRRLLGDPRALLRRPFNVVDPVVNANVVGFLRAVGVEAPEAESFLPM